MRTYAAMHSMRCGVHSPSQLCMHAPARISAAFRGKRGRGRGPSGRGSARLRNAARIGIRANGRCPLVTSHSSPIPGPAAAASSAPVLRYRTVFIHRRYDILL